MTKTERIEAMARAQWLHDSAFAWDELVDEEKAQLLVAMQAAYDAADIESMVREAIRLADRGEGSVPEFTADQIVGRVCGNE